ncbi:MAG: methylenetetrahydrofolate reductase [NAD(P)H] [Oscillospiraceae bacterium]|nr:methylenetetrahydrofolate reductase [NAD(P)H] [Oscillospiraceae bacterium]
MKISEIFKTKTVFSFEVFPPKTTSSVNSVYDTLAELRDLSPDFISVIYGAAGGKNNKETFKIASAIKNNGIESAAHLTCLGMTKADILEKLDELKRIGVENILALRGDMPTDGSEVPKGDFEYASDLISFIKQNGDFDVSGACYPEGHIEASSKAEDILNLKKKVDAGADHLISQLFFDNNCFYSFLERCQIAGINVPIEAGIMPVTNRKQIERMVSLCGATLPTKFLKIMERYENNPIAMRDAGIAYAVDQIVDLITQGVDGIHLYVMNNSYVGRRIYTSVNSLMTCK